jgi:hypothetical protein
MKGKKIMKEQAIEVAKKITERRGYEVSAEQIEKGIDTVVVKHQKPYTVAIINGEYIGISKYNPADRKLGLRWKPVTGTGFAMRRAVCNFLEAINE